MASWACPAAIVGPPWSQRTGSCPGEYHICLNARLGR